MVVVLASGVDTLFEVNLIIGTLLGVVTYDITLTLLSNNITDDTFLTGEVIAYLIGFIGRLSLSKDRLSLYHAQRIFTPIGIDGGAVNIH